MASNAWERAQEAIARAAERDAAVITPDTAVSPFDASTTTVIPHAQAGRHRGPPDPDVTQRLPHRGNGRNGHSVDAHDDARTDQIDARPTSPPSTAPFPANPFPSGGTVGGPTDHDETPATDPPRRSWWRRLFG